jgi:beta-glucosidase
MVTRRQFIRTISSMACGSLVFPQVLYSNNFLENILNNVPKAPLNSGFVWGAASAAFQTEGAWNEDGRTPSIWDTFTDKKGKIKNADHARMASDFYHRYPEDIALLKEMNFNAFRFSLSWSRLLPQGTGAVNPKGVDFYNRVIDNCLELGIVPWVTLYHWDLPQALQNKGGWTNRDIVGWFSEYTQVAAKYFGDRVKHWIILNEPMGFTSFGYLLGIHAPGKIGFRNFLPAVHHAALCQSVGAGVVRNWVNHAQIGTTFSCSPVIPINDSPKNVAAAARIDAGLNRLFIEPSLGMGYPVETLPYLRRLEKYFKPGDENLLPFDFDFIGLQYYFRVFAKNAFLPPLYAYQVDAKHRDIPLNTMGLEIYPDGIADVLSQFSAYKGVKKIYITESGVCYNDKLTADGKIADYERIAYFKATIEKIEQARQKGIPVEGYFVWSLTDNFEWREGYAPRFGLVYIDYQTQKRMMKESGKWFKEYLLMNNL